MSPGQERLLPGPPKPTRSEQVAALVILLSLIAPMAVSVVWHRRPMQPLLIERSGSRQYDLKIDLNIATATELEHLPGIGPKLAQRIIEHRDEYGPFVTLDDVKHVKGIGPKLVEKMKPFLKPLPGDTEALSAAVDP